jgi:hypoxanthine phosphoribosyltransferase
MSEPDLTPYPAMAPDIQSILISAEELQARVRELGRAISTDYAGLNPLLVGVLKGVTLFMADLLRTITIPLEVDFLAVSNYSPEARGSGMVRLEKDLSAPITGRHVLFLEDVVDTGLTLNYLLHTLRARRPASLEVCALFNKPFHRLIDIPLKYTGFDLPDRFVVGYGLDFHEKYRNLPFVGLLKPEVMRKPQT